MHFDGASVFYVGGLTGVVYYKLNGCLVLSVPGLGEKFKAYVRIKKRPFLTESGRETGRMPVWEVQA